MRVIRYDRRGFGLSGGTPGRAADEGPVAERRIPPRLDGGVEGVHVHVRDDSHRQSRGAGSGG